MAQRQEVKKANRMHDSFILQIFSNFSFERLDVGKNVSVGNNHAPRFGGGSRSKNDFERIAKANVRRGKTLARMRSQLLSQIIKQKRDAPHIQRTMLTRTNQQLRTNALENSLREIWRGNVVNRHRNHTAECAPIKNRNPLRRIRSPDQDTIALNDSPSP